MKRDSRRFFLRDSTQPYHTELDRLIGPLTSDLAYRRYLKSLAAFRHGAEQAVAATAWPEILSGWAPVPLSSMMRADLKDLSEIRPALPVFPAPASTSALLGLLYVLEGSSLGARFLARQVCILGYTQDFGARHLTLQTASPENWQDFLQRLDKADDWEADSAASAAQSLFCYALDAVRHTDSLMEHAHG